MIAMFDTQDLIELAGSVEAGLDMEDSLTQHIDQYLRGSPVDWLADSSPKQDENLVELPAPARSFERRPNV